MYISAGVGSKSGLEVLTLGGLDVTLQTDWGLKAQNPTHPVPVDM